MAFSEDTPDGKRTYHGTAMAVYQEVEAQDQVSRVTIDPMLEDRSVKDLPEYITSPAPPSKPIGSIYREFDLLVDEVPFQTRIQDIAWLVGREFTRVQEEDTQVIYARQADAPLFKKPHLESDSSVNINIKSVNAVG